MSASLHNPYTLEAAAVYAGVCKASIYSAIKRDEGLVPIRHGRRSCVTRESLHEWAQKYHGVPIPGPYSHTNRRILSIADAPKHLWIHMERPNGSGLYLPICLALVEETVDGATRTFISPIDVEGDVSAFDPNFIRMEWSSPDMRRADLFGDEINRQRAD